MALSHPQLEDRLLALWERKHTFIGWLSSVDHKDVGKRYLFTAFVFLLIGGVEALLMRLQLARPNLTVLTPKRTTRCSRFTAPR